MKRFNFKLYALYIQDQKLAKRVPLTNQKGWHPMYEFLPLTLKYVNAIPKEYQKVGVYTKNDLIQAGNKGLVVGWGNINWDKIYSDSHPDKKLINFLSASITGAIKRELNKAAVIVSIPESHIRKTKAETLADKLFGNWLYSFRLDDYAPGTTLRFADIQDDRPDYELKDIYALNEGLCDIMWTLTQNERDILRMSFGMDFERKFTGDEIAEHMNMSRRNVTKIKTKALQKLDNEENREYMKSFL